MPESKCQKSKIILTLICRAISVKGSQELSKRPPMAKLYQSQHQKKLLDYKPKYKINISEAKLM